MSLIGTLAHVAEQARRVQEAHNAYVEAVRGQAAAAATTAPQQGGQEAAPRAGMKGKGK